MGSLVSRIFKHAEEAGWGLYPVIVLAGLMLLVAAREASGLRQIGRHLRAVVPSSLLALRASHDVADALGMTAQLDSALGRSVRAGLAQMRRAPDAAESLTRTQRDTTLARLDRRANGLPMVASLATLFGLLGTVTGFVQRPHGCVANADAASRATMLAKGISESLNCIAFALFVAAACLILHVLLDAWRERLRADADHAVALLRAELGALRPYLSCYGERIVDECWGYRGA